VVANIDVITTIPCKQAALIADAGILTVHFALAQTEASGAGHAAEREAEAAASGDACSGISLLCAIWRRDGLINKSRIDPAQIVAVTSGLPLTEELIAAAIFTSREIFSLSFSAAIRA
jgi:hypothetical protein